LLGSLGCNRTQVTAHHDTEPAISELPTPNDTVPTPLPPPSASTDSRSPLVLPADLSITEVARYGAQDTARIVVFLSRPARYQVGRLPAQGGKGPRLFLDVDEATYGGGKQFDVGGVVERVRVG